VNGLALKQRYTRLFLSVIIEQLASWFFCDFYLAISVIIFQTSVTVQVRRFVGSLSKVKPFINWLIW
jgi:hypothetical protein